MNRLPRLDDAPYKGVWLRIIELVRKEERARATKLKKLHAELQMLFDRLKFADVLVEYGVIDGTEIIGDPLFNDFKNQEYAPPIIQYFMDKPATFRPVPVPLKSGQGHDRTAPGMLRWDIKWRPVSDADRNRVQWGLINHDEQLVWEGTCEEGCCQMTRVVSDDCGNTIKRFVDKTKWETYVKRRRPECMGSRPLNPPPIPPYYVDYYQYCAPRTLSHEEAAKFVAETNPRHPTPQ